MEIGEVLKAARQRSGLSARALARRAQTSHATLLAYESNRVDPGTKVAERILRAAGFRPRIELAPEPRTANGRDPGDELADILALAEHLPHRPRSAKLSAPIFPGRP